MSKLALPEPKTSALHYRAARVVGVGTLEGSDLERINALAPQSLTADKVYATRWVVSTDGTDTYYTQMAESSLRNFERNLREGVSFVNAHQDNDIEAIIGRSFWGELQVVPGGSAEGKPATRQVLGSWYIVRDGSPEIERIITKIEGGVYAKMSAGFGGNDTRYVCNTDGSDLFDWSSPFYPGMLLDDGTRVTYRIEDTELWEGSIVHKNSTPGALYQRVAGMAERRLIEPGELDKLGARWGVRFDTPRLFRGVDVPQERKAEDMELRDALKAKLAEVQTRKGAKLSKDTKDRIASLVEKLGNGRSAVDEVATDLADLISDVAAEEANDETRAVVAEFGDYGKTVADAKRAVSLVAYARKHADERIADIAQARVAVQGDKFDAEKYKARLARAVEGGDFDFLDEEADAWLTQRKAALKPRLITNDLIIENRKVGEAGGDETPEGLIIEQRAI